MKLPIELHFLNFLLINDCYKQYFDNLDKEDRFIEHGIRVFYFSFMVFRLSFVFCNTPEGDDYWFNINRKWCDYLNKNKSNICD